MKFGIHNPSWLFGPDPAAAFEGVKAKAQWAETRGFTWFSVMDHLMIAGGGEQLTLRVVARLADACNVFGDPNEVKRKFEILRSHCETEGRPYEAIEKTTVISVLLARDQASLAAKRVRLAVPESIRGFAGTVSEFVDVAGRFRDAGVQLMIVGAVKNDMETLELLASDIIPHFA